MCQCKKNDKYQVWVSRVWSTRKYMHQMAKTILFVDLKLFLEGLATEGRRCRIIGTLQQQRRRITSISASFPTNKGPKADFQTSWDSESKHLFLRKLQK